MKTSKLLLIVGAFVLVVIAGATLDPGTLLPGLGPPFDQPFSLLAFLLFVAVGVIWLFGTILTAHSRGRKVQRSSSAEQILRERYARGELDRVQFTQMLNDLRRDVSPNP